MRHIGKILSLSRPFRKWFIFLSLSIVLVAIIDLSGTVLIKFIIDQIEIQITTGEGDLALAFSLVALMFALNTLSTALNSLNMRLGDYTTGRIGKYLTEIFYRKIFTLPQKYFDGKISGKIVNQLGRGILSLKDFLGALANFIFPALIQTIATIGVLAYFNLVIALFAVLLFPMYIAISYYSTKKWAEYQVRRNKIEDTIRGRIQEVISNIKLVKSYGTEKNEYAFISKEMGKSVSIYDKQSKTYHILNFLRNFGLETALVTIFAIIVYQTFNGILSFGELVLIIQLFNRLRRPLFAMSFILERIKKAETGSKEFFEILNLELSESFGHNPTCCGEIAKTSKTSIKFKNVNFTYDEGVQALKNVSFTLKNNETVALVGESGAGKTTIINLILKFYEPDKGEVFLNGTPYKDLTHQQVRSHISLVFQDSELFSSTIKENVAYGKPNATKAEMLDALKKAHAWKFIQSLPKGINTAIGERGVKLSGGQKQRIQIARAILRNAPILILDEATSSLDAKSEKLVQEALDTLTKDKLVIIIAHRFSTIQNVDRVLVVDNGRIVDMGKSTELAKRKGIYQDLLRYQIEGNQKLLDKYELR